MIKYNPKIFERFDEIRRRLLLGGVDAVAADATAAFLAAVEDETGLHKEVNDILALFPEVPHA